MESEEKSQCSLISVDTVFRYKGEEACMPSTLLPEVFSPH